MKDRRDVAPLPREWLPDPLPPAGDASWAEGVARLMSRATPELAKRGAYGPAPPWWAGLELWLRPATGLAAASLAILLLAPPPEADPPPARDLTLELLAAQGDPTALWSAVGVQADPVLATLTLVDHTALLESPGHPNADGGAP